MSSDILLDKQKIMLYDREPMSYASLDEAFPSISEGPPVKKSKKSKKSSRDRPEPLIVEPDRPAERPPTDVEVLVGTTAQNTRTSSASNYLVAAPDPSEDYFPYPLGADDDSSAFMLQPDWAAQFALSKGIKRHSETTAAPATTPIDGYSTLWRNVPDPKYGLAKDSGTPRRDATNAIGIEDDLREKVDKILERLDSHEYKTTERDTFSEILLFILLGVAIILLLDLFFRSQQYALAHLLTSSLHRGKQTGGGMKRNGLAQIMRKLRASGFI
jgi:hypothetical protein